MQSNSLGTILVAFPCNGTSAEPLDRWSDRANIFQFFSKISPMLEAIGVLLIPLVILVFEINRAEREQQFEENRADRQQQFEERVIERQADVRQQQAVREYLSQVTTIHLETDQGKILEENDELKKLLTASTKAVLDELSLREGTQKEPDELVESDRKKQVIGYLSELGWINSSEDKELIISLSSSNLSYAYLKGAKFCKTIMPDRRINNDDCPP